MDRARRFLVWLVVEVFGRLGVDLQQPPRLGFDVGPVSNQRTAQGVSMKIILTTDQKVTITLNPKTPGGHPATLDGVPAWSTSDPAVIAVQPAEDGKSCTVLAAGSTGLATLGASADADLGEGVDTITGQIDFEVVAAEASDLGFEAGQPELQ